MRTSALDDLAVNTIRMLSIDAVQRANSGHPGMPMGAADMAYTLWADFLRHDPTRPDWPDRDRFVLSAGHGAMLLYALLHLAGYDMTLEDLMSFRQWGSKAPGHPEYGAAPGIEVTTGPLGQGISTAVGMAIAERFLAATFNRPGHEIINHYTYVIASDGDLMEGISSEAASLAGHLKLGKLIVLYDDNDISIEGKTDITFTEDVGMRFRAYGWHVQHVDGFDRPAIAQAIREAQQRADAPSLIICKTILAYGSPNLQNNPEAHGAPLGKEEVILTKQNLGWPADKEFYVPEEVYALFADFRRRWTAERQAWEERFAAYAREYPKEAELLQTLWNNQLPAGWEEHLPPLRSEGKEATRNSSGVVLNAIAPYLPTLMGGSADLAPSNKTYLKGAGDFQAGSYHGRNLRFGVREHAMGAILNGLALHKGPIPYGGTFLVFSDYMRPAIRLAALMELPVIYVFTHDSIFLGEDGPTHQPIEHLAALRAIPHLVVIRPADANETVIAWKVALQRREGPTALILSRQNLPILPQTQQHCAEDLPRGAYVLSDPPTPSLDMILIATGSEVHLALGAQKALLEKGIAARVVSMPSWELFDAQPQEYRDAVLPPAVRRRLVIEAGTSQGWCKYIGEAGRTLTIDGRFGASAPAEVLAEKFGFTVDNVVRIALSMM
ncbi:MAG: transketolase [Anaerolineae bacterium]|nr:transketolase [Anaerolineae bacterium]